MSQIPHGFLKTPLRGQHEALRLGAVKQGILWNVVVKMKYILKDASLFHKWSGKSFGGIKIQEFVQLAICAK